LPHPSESIVGEYSSSLKGRCVALGVTGSVAAYKSIDTARWLLRRGARVRIVLTEPAAQFVTPALWHWAVGVEPVVSLSGEVEHIVLASECDSMLVAPATLSSISKIAYGIADNPVVLTAIAMRAEGKPVIAVPSMHGNMYESLQFKQAIAALTRLGYIVVPPRLEGGVAKYPDPLLLARLTSSVTRRGRDLEGRRILVTAGPTREWIDPVRFISNPSSGRMGIEIAVEAYARGAEVVLVHGPTSLEVPYFIESYRVDTTEEMAEVVERLTGEKLFDAFIAAAAPADYRPARRSESKIRSGLEFSVELKPTPKVVESIVKRPRVLVIFAAETVGSIEELKPLARAKLEKYGADIVVANIVGRKGLGFSADRESGVILSSDGYESTFDSLLKEDLAGLILDLVSKKLSGGV